MTPIERKIQKLRDDGEDDFVDMIETWRSRAELWRIADSALEDINEVMWESYMVKDREFGRNEGAKIMAALNRWCTGEADKQKQAALTRRQARPQSPTPIVGLVLKLSAASYISRSQYRRACAAVLLSRIVHP